MGKILKYIVLYSTKLDIKEEIIRYVETPPGGGFLVELINIKINRVISEKIIERKRLLSRISKLEKLNHINDYKLISYNFNKNGMIMKSILSKLIIKLLENVINGVDLKSGGKRVAGGEIIISKPVIKENLNSVNILFYYFIPNNKTYRYFSRINTLISKIKNYKELVKNVDNGGYKKLSFLSQDKLIVSNIFNKVVENRNNVLYLTENVNNIISDLNKNENNESSKLLLKEELNKNLMGIGKLPGNLIINNALLNVSILNKRRQNINKEVSEMKLMLNKNTLLLNKIYSDIESSSLNLSSLNSSSLLIRELHSKIKLDRSNLISDYKLINGLSGDLLNENNIKEWDLKTINRKNDSSNIYGYMVSYVDILLNQIIGKGNKSNDIKLIISKYFGLKEVTIEGINLKYEFNNPDILLKLIRKGISKKTRTLSRMFRFRLSNRIPLLNEKGILKNKISNNVMKNMLLNNNILNVEKNIRVNMLNNLGSSYDKLGDDISVSYLNDIKDYNNSIILDDNDQKLNNEILYKNIVGWSLLLKGKVGARKGKNRSNRILITKGSFKNNNLFINNILEEDSKNNGYSKDRLKLNYIKNSNFISYMDKSTNNGKLGLTLKVNIL